MQYKINTYYMARTPEEMEAATFMTEMSASRTPEMETARIMAELSGVHTEEHPTGPDRAEQIEDAEMFYHAMAADDDIGVGVFIMCHGKTHPEVRRIPEGINVMKKNVSLCGVPAPTIYSSYRFKGQTAEVIAEELTRSFALAFSAEECMANEWRCAREGILYGTPAPGRPPIKVPLCLFACEEFNTTPENKVSHFVYKSYLADKDYHCVLVTFGGKRINLLTCTMEELTDTFGMPMEQHENAQEIMEILHYIQDNISTRELGPRHIISTDLIFNVLKYLNLMYGVKVARILDESCNTGLKGQPVFKDDKKDGYKEKVGYGGKRKSRQKNRKKRKSKKLF
jgi:hypothetical protein